MRDSYALSGMSLAKTAENLTEHTIRKLKGDLDYRPVRFPSTPLTKAELEYCYNDVKIICCYIAEQIKMYDGDITKIPLLTLGELGAMYASTVSTWRRTRRPERSFALTRN